MITYGLWFRVGVSMVLGLIWTSPAVGDGPLFAPAVNYEAGGCFAISVAIADLDGDQVPDLAVANSHIHTVSVLLGVGHGTFAASESYAVGHFPNSVAIGDLDGDHVPDLVVSNEAAYDPSDDGVSVLLGVGDGTFAPAVNYAAGYGLESIVIADLDGDLVPDLAVANKGSASVSVLLGVGDGTFAQAVDYPAGAWPQSLAIADLNGDQVPDLTVANSKSHNVAVMLGLGDGTFAAAVHYAAGDWPISIAIGNLDGDQVPDLAVANYKDDNVSILLGVGDGTFAVAVNYTAGDRPGSVAIADLDGDQIPDLAVGNSGVSGWAYNVAVLLGADAGTLGPVWRYPTDNGPPYVAIGDLDGDKVPDLAVANWVSSNVSVLLNKSPALGDVDGDGDVDLDDFALYPNCMTGPDHGPYIEGCNAFDFDGDLDVDLRDLAGFQNAFGLIP